VHLVGVLDATHTAKSAVQLAAAAPGLATHKPCTYQHCSIAAFLALGVKPYLPSHLPVYSDCMTCGTEASLALQKIAISVWHCCADSLLFVEYLLVTALVV
jgi:hypothetical protein